LNIAFESINKHPQYIAIMAPPKANGDATSSATLTSIQRQLLGDKGYNQLEKMFMFLASMRSILISDDAGDDREEMKSRANLALQNKLQLLSILLNILAYRLMEVRSQSVSEFMRKILECGDIRTMDVKRCRSILADVPSSDEVLSTGLPLFLALWQVFHYHIEQEVPHTLLQKRLMQEQWRLLNSIVESYELGLANEPSSSGLLTNDAGCDLSEGFLAYMSVQAKRWQATLLLLIDSLALASEVLTPERLDFLNRIGEYMEWEGTIAHDLARYTRAVTERVPNAFVFWLKQKGLHAADGEDFVDEFHRATDLYAATKWKAILQDRESVAARVFSLPAVERVVHLIRGIYGERSGRRSRKESF
jgi:hydroxymethylglutaryl-CoA synthase